MASKKRRRTYKFAKYMKKKLIMVFIFVFLLLVSLIIRLMYIQKTSGEKYQKIVLNQLGYDSETIPFQRGEILDAKGTILATSEDVYNVILDCKLIHEKEEYIEPTIRAILSCFKDVEEEELRTLLKEKSDSRYCVLRKKLPYEEIQDFVQLKEAVYTEGSKKGKSVNPNVQGVWFEKEYVRKYPYDSLACKVLGFTTSGNVGIGGLEDYYNDTLNGVNGRRYGYLNSDNNLEKTIKNAVNGNSLVTTLDVNVQSVVEKKIAQFNEQYRNNFTEGAGSANTAVLVMNPNNGEIIAMADSSSYNLNDPWDEDILTTYCTEYKNYTTEEVESFDEEKKLDMLNALWQNFCITYTYEPGSTVKPFTVAAGLDTGKLTGNETYECDGGEEIGEHYISCVNKYGHGIESLEQALMDSCNDALMQIGFRIGVETFTKYQNIFNIGLKTGIDLPGEARTDTLIYTSENMGKTSLATNAFGQNFNTTMVQVAAGFASVINGGYYYQPHFVKKIVDENGGTVQTIEGLMLKQTISEQTSDTVRGYLESTVARGTGQTAKVPGYSMGGKTGTAEKQPRSLDKYLVSFIGFAPAENPEVLIYVVIDEPNLEDQAQSTLATTLARDILAEIFPYLNIYPDEPIIEEETDEETVAGDEGTEENAGANSEANSEEDAGENTEANSDENSGASTEEDSESSGEETQSNEESTDELVN